MRSVSPAGRADRAALRRGRARAGLPIAGARRLLWMFTSRDLYRMLVHESGCTPDRYEAWLAQTLVEALVES